MNTYYDIYGPITEVVRGKSTNKKVKFAQGVVDTALKEQRVMQTLTTDIMYLNKQTFLITVASPLELTISPTEFTNKEQHG